MIKNDRQYRITKAQVPKFAHALEAAQSRALANPLLRKLESDALQSQLQDLKNQLRDYERLRSRRRSVIRVNSFSELATALIRARILSGLSQKELARRLGLKEQQIQRYEATDYRSANLERLEEVAVALGVEVRGRVSGISQKR